MLNYPYRLGSEKYTPVFASLHLAPWNEPAVISSCFNLHKIVGRVETYRPGPGTLNLVYFDAFGPDAQPELWTGDIFRALYEGLQPGGILTTYSVKGTVVRALQAAGFKTEKLPGPPGKRHILRAVKL